MVKGITLKDIAEKVGVSRTLVSVCLSGRYKQGNYRISEKTAEKVRVYAESVGYVVNRSAQKLRLSGDKAPVGVLLSQDCAEARSMSAVNYALDILAKNNRESLLIGHRDLLKAVRQLKGSGVRDFLHFGSFTLDKDDPLDRRMQKALAPLLKDMRGFALDYNFSDSGLKTPEGLFCFGIDRTKLLRELLKSYRQSGKDGFLCMDCYQVKKLQQEDFFFDDRCIYYQHEAGDQASAFEVGRGMAQRYLELRKQHPVRLIFASDTVAGSIIAELALHNVKVPEDVEVAGFDNLDVGKCFRVPLTSFGVPLMEHVELALECIINKRSVPQYLVSAPQISWRGSTVLPDEEIERFEKSLQ